MSVPIMTPIIIEKGILQPLLFYANVKSPSFVL